MKIFELEDFYDWRFQQAFRAYFMEIGVDLKADTDVFDEITESYEKERMRTFVLEDKSCFVGFIMLQPECLKGSFFEEQVGFIQELWVAASCRHQGYGRQLLEAAEDYFRQREITKLILTYEEEALTFYQKRGFVPAGSYKAKNDGKVLIKYL